MAQTKCLNYCDQVTIFHFHLTIGWKNILLNLGLTFFRGGGGLAIFEIYLRPKNFYVTFRILWNFYIVMKVDSIIYEMNVLVTVSPIMCTLWSSHQLVVGILVWTVVFMNTQAQRLATLT